MKRVFRPFLAVLMCAVISASGCSNEDELLEEEAPGADVTAPVAEDVAEKAESAPDVDASSSGGAAGDGDSSSGDVDAGEPSAGDEAKQETATQIKTQRKKSFYGESGDLEGTPVEPPAPWRRVTCDGDSS